MEQPQQKAEQSGFGGFKGLIKIVRALDHHCVIWVREHELPGWIGHIPVSVAAMILLAGTMVDFEYVMVMLLTIIILLFYAFSTMVSGHHRTDDDQNSGLCCYRTEENMKQPQQKAEQSQQKTEQLQQETEQEYEQSDFKGARGLIRIVKVVNYHFSVWAREHGLPGWTGHIPVSAAALIILTEIVAHFENILTFLGVVLGIVFFVLFTAFTGCEWGYKPGYDDPTSPDYMGGPFGRDYYDDDN